MEDHTAYEPDDTIDLADLLRRLRTGLPATLGLAFLGLAVGILIGLVATSRETTVSTLRVTFGFPGVEHGKYPNGSNFHPDDVRAPDVVNEAIKQLGIPNATPELASRVRGAISISGIVPQNIIKERDRLRAAGQTVAPYFPDEYEVSLFWPRDDALDSNQRELLLAEIINGYREKFRRLYAVLPLQFENAFEQLRTADFVDYELVLNRQMDALTGYLEQLTREAKQFRSPSSNLSFQDLLKQAQLFSRIRMKEVLGIIYQGALSKDRAQTLAAMDYQLQQLEFEEQRLKEEEAVVLSYLTRAQERGQTYVLATRTDLTQGTQPIVDQDLIDGLLANDAYNQVLKRALEASLAVKKVQVEKAQLLERKKRLETIGHPGHRDSDDSIKAAEKALEQLENGYSELLSTVRVCLEDYARQEYADAIRITMPPQTKSWIIAVALGAIIGMFTGTSAGLGLSLLFPRSTRKQ